jgi:poly-gamma-glutamate capsule biosynthesis protein CapA/YwtB (metallophosphatase superfamily)
MKPLVHARHPPPDSLLRAFHGVDYVIGNLEVPLTDVDDPQREDIVLRGDPALVDDIPRLGMDAVSLANNHCGDHGWSGLADTAARLERAGVVPLGVGVDVAEAFRPVVRRVAATDLAIVTATCVGFDRYMATAERSGMAGLRVATSYERNESRLAWEPATVPHTRTTVDPADAARLVEAVTAARQQASVVIAVLHWGVSWADRPADYQHELGHKVVEAGATAVFGCHSHTVQGVEVHRGAPIFHGLGSFVFGYDGPLAARMPRDAAVGLVDVSSSGQARAARLLLGRLDANGEPVRAHPERAALLAEIVGRNSAAWGARAELEADTLVVPL